MPKLIGDAHARPLVASAWKNAFQLGGSRILARALAFAWSVVLARSLGVDGFGVYAFLAALAILISLITEAGITTVVVRDVANDVRHLGRTVPTALTLAVALNMLGAACLVAFALHSSGTTVQLPLALIIAAYLPVNGLNNVLAAVLRGRNLFGVDSALNILDAMFFALLSGLALAAHLGLVGVLAAFTGRQIVILALYLIAVAFYVTPMWLRLEWPAARYLVTEGLPLTISGAASHVYVRVDLVILTILAGTGAAGIYSLAGRFMDAMLVGAAAIGAATLPYFGRLVADRASELRRTMQRVALGFALAATVAIIAFLPFAPVVVTTLFGPPFAVGGRVLQVLLLAVPFYVASQVLRSGLIVARRQWPIGLIFLIAVPLNVVLNLYLIPRFGVFGAAYASLSTSIYVLIALTLVTLPRRKTSWMQPNVTSLAFKGLDE